MCQLTVSEAFDPSSMTRVLREHGYAVTVFNAEELRGADTRHVENRLVELGNEVIEDLRDPSSREEDDEEHEELGGDPEAPVFDPSPLTRALREQGCAMALFSPAETVGVDNDDLEDRLVELGNEVIDVLAPPAARRPRLGR